MSSVKLSKEIAGAIEEEPNPDSHIGYFQLKDWQQRAEYLETSLAQRQGEEYDLEEPLFMVQLGLNELDMLIDFIEAVSRVLTVQRLIPTETWQMLNEKIQLLNIQVSKFNEQKAAAIAGAGNEH